MGTNLLMGHAGTIAEVTDERALQVAPSGTVTLTHAAVVVADATTPALAANANRKYALFQNNSDTDIYIKVGGNAVANEGIRLTPNGGFYEMVAGTNVDTRVVNAIHGVAGQDKSLLVTEGV